MLFVVAKNSCAPVLQSLLTVLDSADFGCRPGIFPPLTVGLAVRWVQADQIDAQFVEPVEDVVQLDSIDDLNVQDMRWSPVDSMMRLRGPLVDLALDHDLVPDRPTRPL